jgi:hypothetical protein
MSFVTMHVLSTRTIVSCLFVYVCMCVCVYVYIYVCVCMYTYMYVYMYVCMRQTVTSCACAYALRCPLAGQCDARCRSGWVSATAAHVQARKAAGHGPRL